MFILNKIPGRYILVIYLASIFLFAFVFNQMPNEFYHSTIEFESTISTDNENIRNDLENYLKNKLRTVYDSDFVKLDDSTALQIESLRVEYFDVNSSDRRAYFSINGDFWGKGGAIYPWGLDVSISYTRFDTVFQQEYLQVICSRDKKWQGRFPIKLNRVFLIEKFGVGGGLVIDSDDSCDCGWVTLSGSLINKITAYSNALNGFPSYSSGSFERMVYLSAVTIATVGYGDIVPITPRARMLVSIEAIWGVILIGLYLNSLANKIASSKQ